MSLSPADITQITNLIATQLAAARVKISDLPGVGPGFTTAGVFPFVDNGSTQKISLAQILAKGFRTLPVGQDLRGIDTTTIDDGAMFYITGILTPNDGGEGLWFYDASSVAADNVGTVISPDDGQGRFLRQFDGPFYPEWFGAVGDGATDDYTPIQSCINACAAYGGGRETWFTKNYGIGTMLELPSTIKIVGVTDSTTLPLLAPDPKLIGARLTWVGGAADAMVLMQNTQGVKWEGVSLFGDMIANPTSTLVGFKVKSTAGFYNSQRNWWRNLTVANVDLAWGFSLDAPNEGNLDGWVIEQFLIYNVNTGIKTNSDNCLYAKISNGAIAARDAGIDLTRAGGILIESVAGAKSQLGAGNDNGTFLAINAASGNVKVVECEAENADPLKYSFAVLSGTKLTATIFENCEHNIRTYVTGTHTALIFIGPHFNYELRVSGDNNYIKLIRPTYEMGHGTVDSGTGNYFDDDTKNTLGFIPWVPRLYQGTTEITGLTNTEAYIQRVGNLVIVNCNIFKASGAPSASGDWTIQNIPYQNSITGPFIFPAGDVSINSTDYHVLTPYFWKLNILENGATLIGAEKSTSWTTGFVIFEFTGVFICDP